VYVVTREPDVPPTFLKESVGGPHKRAPLTVGIDKLEQAWRDQAEVVYVGKAAGRGGLQERLWAYARQGLGHPAGHAGGRFIWQLAGSDELVVGWMETIDETPEDVEEALLAMHIEAFGRRPFANLKGGTKIGEAEARTLLTRGRRNGSPCFPKPAD
jgi:hypothetical protein